jgi:hypothetical protein
MDAYRLRVKIGTAEFEAEGPEQMVKEQFEEFKRMIEPRGSGPGPATTSATPNGSREASSETAYALPLGYERMYQVEERSGRRFVKLHFLPTGEGREAVALRLVLLGYRKVLNEDRVRVTTLLETLRGSGLPIQRLDLYAGEAVNQGLLLKGGTGKGGTYGLSVTGLKRAEEELAEMLARA